MLTSISAILTRTPEGQICSVNLRVQFGEHVVHRTVLGTATPQEVANALQSLAYELRKL